MSADNGYIVSKLTEGEDQRLYGIFDLDYSDDKPPEWYTEENARQLYLDPVMAILMAHRLEQEYGTEYGVFINNSVLKAALKAR
jgi:hypothetical protein